MQCDEMRAGLINITKEAHGIWEENKDLQVNKLTVDSAWHEANAEMCLRAAL